MALFAILLIVVSAVAHASWNLICKAKAPSVAFFWLLILWGLVLWMIFTFRKVDSTAAKLQIPYLLWLTFAAWLNLGVWYLNR